MKKRIYPFVGVFSFLFLTAQFAQAAIPLEQRLKGPKAGAHQGGVFHSNPNTIERFESARKTGVDIVEMDVRLTKDGVPVIYHDETLNRWTWCKGKVSDKTLKEIQNCHYKLTHYDIPTFEDVLRWAQGRVVINAEFKSKEVVVPAVDLVAKYHAHEWVFFQCKDDPIRYQTARARDPHVALLFAPDGMKKLNWALRLKDPRLLVIELHENIRTPEIIQRIHKAGKFVLEDSWHFDPLIEIFGASCRKVFQMGMDIAISHRTSSCVRQRNAHSSHLALAESETVVEEHDEEE